MPLARRATLLVAALSLVALAGCGSGSSTADAAGTLRVIDATVDVPANPDLGAVRMVVDNRAATADELVGASSPDADAVTIHRSTVDDQMVSSMEQVEQLDVPARSKVTFAAGGLHVMLEGLHRELEVGDTVELRLTFAEAGTRTVEVQVTEPGTAPDPSDTEEHDDHGS